MNNISIRYKLWLAFGMVILLASVMGGDFYECLN